MKKRIFILDTNVLMHDPSALYRFEEHDLFIPMVVLEELDAAKKGTSEVSRNARQVSRFLDDLMRDKDHTKIEQGLQLPTTQQAMKDGTKPASGRLFFQTRPPDASLPAYGWLWRNRRALLDRRRLIQGRKTRSIESWFLRSEVAPAPSESTAGVIGEPAAPDGKPS